MSTIRRLFIANRGEIAVRVIRTCRQLGIETILGTSAADLDSLAARLADHTVCLGAAPSADSYLNIPAVIAAAHRSQADALHPGYGFLSENKALAAACAAHGIVFVGASEANLDAVGDKLKARGHAVAAGLPVVPGGAIADLAGVQEMCERIGLPLLVKAVGGGGGRGMKLVHAADQLSETIALAVAEAQAAFGDSRVYLERYIAAGRHIEVQLLGDGHDVIHLGTRDCSIQRRYQKLLEEAPAPRLTDDLRASLHDAAVAFGRHLAYRGLGTVEFLVDAQTDAFYFLEMNARIQVEHPVTEAITGLDLVALQIAIAEGRRLPLLQNEVRFVGHAIECRLNAEDWTDDFRPSPGRVEQAVFPVGDGIRVDTHIQPGCLVPPFYDSLLAKLIVQGNDRTAAVEALGSALDACRITGVATTLPLHKALCETPEFLAAGMDTGFFPRFLAGRGF